MTNINEVLSEVQSLTDFLNEQRTEQIDEGLKDIINSLKKKFKQVVQYLRGLVAKIGSYWIPVDDNGELMPAISPLTIGQAYADGLINKESTAVIMTNSGKKATGCNGKRSDAKSLYGSGNSIDYWMRAIKECAEVSGKPINEVKLKNEDPAAGYNVVDTPMLKKMIQLHLKNKQLSRLMIWGAPGIGKTAILMSVLSELPDGKDWNLVVKTLSNETPDNFTLPKYVEVNGEDKATDVPKTWLPVYKPTGDRDKDQMLDDACGKGLLFIDELSRATPQVLNVILPLINEGMFNGYQIGSGWRIIVASNRAEDEMSGQSDIGNALGNRFAQLYYEPTCKSWSEWAKNEGYMSPLLIQWLNLPSGESMSGADFFYMDPNETLEGAGITKLMCTPRSWTNAMRELACYSETGKLEGFTIFDIPEMILALTLNKYVPKQAVDGFLAFLHVIQKIGNFDQAVHDIWKNGGKNFKLDRKNLQLVALPVAQLVITAHKDSLPSEEEFNNLCDWLVAQNSDQLTSYVMDIMKAIYISQFFKEDKAQGALFMMPAKVKRLIAAGQTKEADAYRTAFKAFANKWGYDNIEDMPDYNQARIQKLGKAFGASFASAMIDGEEGLG